MTQSVVASAELGTSGIFQDFKKIEDTYFFQAYSLLPISMPVLFKNPTSSQINLIKECKKRHFSLMEN